MPKCIFLDEDAKIIDESELEHVPEGHYKHEDGNFYRMKGDPRVIDDPIKEVIPVKVMVKNQEVRQENFDMSRQVMSNMTVSANWLIGCFFNYTKMEYDRIVTLTKPRRGVTTRMKEIDTSTHFAKVQLNLREKTVKLWWCDSNPNKKYDVMLVDALL